MRWTATQVAAYRAKATVCELCGEAFTVKNPRVVDHDHKTGEIRGVLHRGCNALLGVIENGRSRYQLVDVVRFVKFLGRLVEYIYRKRPDAPLYHLHRSEDEKRLLRNKRARLARVARTNE